MSKKYERKTKFYYYDCDRASSLRVNTHRGEEEALHAYVDKLHAENQGSRVYKPDDNVADAIAEYLKNKKI